MRVHLKQDVVPIFSPFQRSSRGHSADEWPHYCQGVSCPERPLGQSWPGMPTYVRLMTPYSLDKKNNLNPHFMKMLSLFCKQVSNLQYEMLLLTDSISKEGGCWELRLSCGKNLFLTSTYLYLYIAHFLRWWMLELFWSVPHCQLICTLFSLGALGGKNTKKKRTNSN